MPGKSKHIHTARPRYATIEEAAEYLSAHPITIRRMIAEGKLTRYNGYSTRLLRVDLNELDAVMAGDK